MAPGGRVVRVVSPSAIDSVDLVVEGITLPVREDHEVGLTERAEHTAPRGPIRRSGTVAGLGHDPESSPLPPLPRANLARKPPSSEWPMATALNPTTPVAM